jgi:hypothetical protein
MKDELRQVAKDTLKLFYLCEQLNEMNDPNTKRYYDSLDFAQIEKEIKEMKEFVISKIEKL